MFANLSGWEIGVLLLMALFIFGPERLPKLISDGLRMIRTLRTMARNATADLSKELGTDVRIEDLHPKTFIRKHLLSEEEEQSLRRPFEETYRDLHQLTSDTADQLNGRSRTDGTPAPRPGESGDHSARHGYDTDAT